MKIQRLTFIIAGLTALLAFSVLVKTEKVSALTGGEFQAGRIIDDAVFFNGNSMDQNTIQNFLNSKLPSCDTNGTQPYGGTTRAAYGTSRGNPPPYTCLKNYRQDTPVKPAESGLCGGFNGGNKSSAQIISEVAQSCGVSPKVLIVLLEKEQSLVTDSWPWNVQYRSATGYGCPDTAPCDAEYYGFFNQVYHAARQYKRYARDANLFGYRAGRNNYIRYNPNAACGGTNVYIQNQATAGLYNYTPYQPNPSALANLYGSGDGCGAYGNRNFWRLFNDWFGSTYSNCSYIDTNGKQYRLYNAAINDYLYTSNFLEICLATGTYGYIHDGYTFSTVSPSSAGSVPVYRLTIGSRHFYTANSAEKDYVVNNLRYNYDGVAFYAMSTAQAGYDAVYRLRSPSGNHFYTASVAERDHTAATRGYVYEGIAFYSPSDSQSTATAVYRLLTPRGQHFYTASVAERDHAAAIGYINEGIAYYSKTVSANDTVPVYRVRSPLKHIYTTNFGERVHLLNSGFVNEGIAFYAPAASDTVAPIYRLYRGTDGDHLYTTSVLERDAASARFGYRYEGIAYGSY